MCQMHIVAAPKHLEGIVESQKRLQEVLLIPKIAMFNNPILRIFGGKEYVVHMDEYARVQSWKNLKKFPLNV